MEACWRWRLRTCHPLQFHSHPRPRQCLQRRQCSSGRCWWRHCCRSGTGSAGFEAWGPLRHCKTSRRIRTPVRAGASALRSCLVPRRGGGVRELAGKQCSRMAQCVAVGPFARHLSLKTLQVTESRPGATGCVAEAAALRQLASAAPIRSRCGAIQSWCCTGALIPY
jgi:hypothetical protein